MGAAIAGIAVLLLLLLLAQGFVSTPPKTLVKSGRIAAGVVVALVSALLALEGRIPAALLGAAIAAALFTGGPMPWTRAHGGRTAPAPRGAMTRQEALNILGLKEGASAEGIRAAHRRLIQQTHPDKGGTDYLAAKINQAKDVLLGG